MTQSNFSFDMQPRISVPTNPVQYNGHVISACPWFDEYHVKCLVCEESYTHDLPDVWPELSENEKAIYTLFQLSNFNSSCNSDANSLRDIMRLCAKNVLR
jgi:hypothetical protein